MRLGKGLEEEMEGRKEERKEGMKEGEREGKHEENEGRKNESTRGRPLTDNYLTTYYVLRSLSPWRNGKTLDFKIGVRKYEFL